MDTSRFVITDCLWDRMEAHFRGRKKDPGCTGGDPRMVLEAVFWIARTGAPWRDLPLGFGNWNTIYRLFRDWARAS